MAKNDENQELNMNTNWKKVLDLIKENKFYEIYKNYTLYKKEGGYLIEKSEKDKITYIFLFDERKSVKIYFDDKNFVAIEIFTSLEIDKYIESKNKEKKDVYIRGMKGEKYFDNIKNLGFCLKNLELELREKNPLDNLELKDALNFQKDYTPKEYSKFFYDYFIYEDKDKENEKILFKNNIIRENILTNILVNLREKEELKTFKFTGPSSIGKSFTLLRISHTCYNIAYINLKILDKNKDDLHYTYSIIISELQRFDISKYLEDLNSLIKKNYYDNNTHLELLLNIMEFLNNFVNLKINFVFIFDQFKHKYIADGFLEKIKTFNKIKIVLCSSINDKNMREECYKTWFLIGKNLVKLKKDNQEYFFYFSKIYNYKKVNKNPENKIFKKLGYMPKYVNKYKDCIDENIMLDEVKEKIENKIEEFCSSYGLEKSLLYSNLRYIINKEYSYEKFEAIIKYCPLKYFVVNFGKYKFIIKPIFPFMKIIINYKLKEIECYDYFKKEKYKNDVITNNYIKGDYFEASAKFELVKLKFPEKKNFITKIVNEIVSMDKLIDKRNRYYMEENEEEEDNSNSEEEIDEKNKDFDDTTSIQEIIKKNKENNINNNLKSEINKNELIDIEKNDNNENYIELDIEEEEDEEEEEINYNKEYCGENIDNTEEIREEEEEEKKDKKKQSFNKELDKILNSFKIETNREAFKEEGLSNEAKLFSKNIEDFRIDEINEQRKKKEIIESSDLNGNESIFLDQFSKWGKALDFAYLYGDKNNKVFLGFQMKCYFENSDLNDKVVNKFYIKNSCRKILVNSMKLFNCKITQWYYYLIFYYNRGNINENISKNNLKKCDENNISYFFYDPRKKKFLIKGKRKYIKMKEITTNENANLEITVTNIKKFAFAIDELSKLQVGSKHNEMKESFKKDLIKALKMDENSKITDILDQIKLIIDAKDYSLFFHLKCKFNKGLICPKYEDYILLYKKKMNEKDNIDFIAGILENKIVKYIELSTKKVLDHIYDVIDEDGEYFYCLFRHKFKKLGKRKKKRSLRKQDFGKK